MRIAAVVTAIMLSGCLYEFPLTPFPSTNIDTRLLGVFEYNEPVIVIADGIETTSVRTHRVAIVRQDVSRYTILYKNVTDAPAKVLQFTGWISRVDENYYLSFRDDDPASPTFGKFGFVDYAWTWPSSMVISAPGVDPATFTSSYGLRGVVRQMLRQEALFPFQPTLWERIARVWWDIDSDDPTANIPDVF